MELLRGEQLRLRVAVSLNGLQPEDLRVEFIGRRLLPEADREPPPLSSYRRCEPAGEWHALFGPSGEHEADGSVVFTLDAQTPECGQFTTELRMYPSHELLSHPYELGLMRWAVI